MFQKHPEWIPAEFDNSPKPYIEKLVLQNETSHRELMLALHPIELIKQFGDDASALRSYFQNNLSFLYFQDDKFVVDENVRRIGIANNDVKLIEYCIANVDSQSEGQAAEQILKRYTLESFDTKEQWSSWYDTNRSRLYFSDTGGYKFFVSQAK